MLPLICEDNVEVQSLLPWAGRQLDTEGIKRADGRLLEALEVIDAVAGGVVEQGERVAIDGVFRYRARITGKIFTSAWAVHARVIEDRIVQYRFYENSHAVAVALSPSGRVAEVA